MKLGRHPTRPDVWQAFDEDGRLVAVGHLEVGVDTGSVAFVADRLGHEQESHDRKPTVIGRG